MTIDFIRAVNPAWFEASPFFKTRVHSRVYHAHSPEIAYFVTSEWFPHDGRRYSVRRFNSRTGEITTLQTLSGKVGFGTFHTRSAAHAYAFAMSNEANLDQLAYAFAMSNEAHR